MRSIRYKKKHADIYNTADIGKYLALILLPLSIYIGSLFIPSGLPDHLPLGSMVSTVLCSVTSLIIARIIMKNSASSFLHTSTSSKSSPNLMLIFVLTLIATLLCLSIVYIFGNGSFSVAGNLTVANYLGIAIYKKFTNILVIVTGVILVPVAEEIVFRGLLFGSVLQILKYNGHSVISLAMACVISSSLYALLFSGTISAFFLFFILSLLLSLCYHFTGTLLSSTLAHSFTASLIFFFLLYSPNQAFKGPPILLVILFVGPFISAILTAVLGRLFLGKPSTLP